MRSITLESVVAGIAGALAMMPVGFFFLALQRMSSRSVSVVGAAYGALYYGVVNALALPLYFGDQLPWALGWQVVVPSLTVHVVFGITAARVARYVRRGRHGAR